MGFDMLGSIKAIKAHKMKMIALKAVITDSQRLKGVHGFSLGVCAS